MTNTLETLRLVAAGLAANDPADVPRLASLPPLGDMEREYLRTHLLSATGLPESPSPSKGRRPCLVVDVYLDGHFARISKNPEHDLLLGAPYTVPEVHRIWEWDPSLVLPRGVQPDATLHIVQSIAYELSEDGEIIPAWAHILKEVFQRQVWCAESLDHRDFVLESHLDEFKGTQRIRTPRQWLVDWMCESIGAEDERIWVEFARRYAMASGGMGFRE